MYYISQTVLNRSKKNMILQLCLNVLFIFCFFLISDIKIFIFIPFSIGLWGIVLNRVYFETSLYLRGNNQVLYDKWRSARSSFKENHLVIITVRKIKKKDYNEIQNKEIVELLRGAKRSYRTLVISVAFMIVLILVELNRWGKI